MALITSHPSIGDLEAYVDDDELYETIETLKFHKHCWNIVADFASVDLTSDSVELGSIKGHNLVIKKESEARTKTKIWSVYHRYIHGENTQLIRIPGTIKTLVSGEVGGANGLCGFFVIGKYEYRIIPLGQDEEDQWRWLLTRRVYVLYPYGRLSAIIIETIRIVLRGIVSLLSVLGNLIWPIIEGGRPKEEESCPLPGSAGDCLKATEDPIPTVKKKTAKLQVVLTKAALRVVQLFEFKNASFSSSERMYEYVNDRVEEFYGALYSDHNQFDFDLTVETSKIFDNSGSMDAKDVWKSIRCAEGTFPSGWKDVKTGHDTGDYNLTIFLIDPKYSSFVTRGQAKFGCCDKKNAYCVVLSGTEAVYTFAHEIGHLFGMAHAARPPYNFSSPETGKRENYLGATQTQTIMGTDFGRLRLPVFSTLHADASTEWDGWVVGSATANNTKAFELNYQHFSDL